MLIDAPGIRNRLRGIATRLAPATLREDLVQEAMVHLWHMEQRSPGKTETWYLQGCRFHLQNYLRHGRSIDSLKRSWNRAANDGPAAGAVSLAESGELNCSSWEEIGVNDFIAVLLLWITPEEKDTLFCLMEGLSARQAAKRLNISHTMVNRHRTRIANLALKLESAAQIKGLSPP